MRRASALGALACVAACAAGSRPGKIAALGWSLGGEAHVFVTSDRFARELYQALSGSKNLTDSLARRPLLAVEDRSGRVATVLSANGAAPGRMTLARFHAPETCGRPEVVTELVFAFPPGGATGRSTPRSHATVVALVGTAPFAGGAGTAPPVLSRQRAIDLVSRLAIRAGRARLLAPLELDPDRAADAGEVLPLSQSGGGATPRYAVAFRARYLAGPDTILVTGVAHTDPGLRDIRWIVQPVRARLTGGMIAASTGSGGLRRYSLRGTVAGPRGTSLLLLDEIADVSPRESRATAVDPATRRVVAAKPLALRCP